MKTVLMLHGISHNMFGKRDPVQYGTITLAEIDARLQALGFELGVQVESFQTNSEGAMCERIHMAFEERCGAVLINAGGVDTLQLRHTRCAGYSHLPGCRTAHVQHSRPGAVPTSLGIRRDRRWANLRLRG